MSRKLFSNSLLRGISDVAGEIRMLANPHQPSPTSEIQAIPPLHLPDVQASVQYLIDMGLTAVLSTRLSVIHTEFVAWCRQVSESHFRRAIEGSYHLRPEHYRDTFVVQFKGTIQVLESQFISAAWVWLCRTGQAPAHFRPQCMDIRVDPVTKAQIISRLGLKPTSFIMEGLDQTSNRIEQLEEGYKNEGDSIPLPQRPSNLSTRDLFQLEKSSTCFPACYPPPGEPIFSPRKALVTQFKFAPSANNEKSVANCSTDVPSLTAVFGKMSVMAPAASLKTQENRKCAWAPSSKTSEAPPLLSPVTASMSGSPRNSQSNNLEVVSSVKSITKPRKRKIAALPKRSIKATSLLTRDPSSPPAANLPISRTPSLVSDTSSCGGSPSSSDELDTPPSTPPSHLPALIARNALPTTVTSSKSKTKRPFGLPIRTYPDFPHPRRGEGIHIDFTNIEAVRGQQLSFTFSA